MPRVLLVDAPARLPLSLSIETFGGVSMMLIFRYTALPVVRREVFSTAADNQTSVEVHVLVGDRTLATDNVTIGKFTIVQTPAAPRGVPIYEVELCIGRDGVFRFGARDKRTGQPQPATASTVLTSLLSASTVALMLDEAKAEEARGEYGVPRTTPDELDSVTVLRVAGRRSPFSLWFLKASAACGPAQISINRADVDRCTSTPGCFSAYCAGAGGSFRRPIHRSSDTGAIPGRAAAWLMARDVRIATRREVAFSISESDAAA